MTGLIRFAVAVVFTFFALSNPTLAQDPPIFQFSFGEQGSEDGQINRPRGIAVKGNEVYVVEYSGVRVSVFDLSGNFLRKFGTSANAEGGFVWPFQVAVADDGTSYVTDLNRNHVLKFDPSGAFVLEWGGLGSADNQFNMPQGIAIDDDGDVWVVDRLNGVLKEFDTTGAFLSKVDGGNQMGGATDMVPSSDGSFFVSIWGNSFQGVRHFSSVGMLLNSSPFIQVPQGIAQAPDGVLYLAATAPAHRIYAVDPMSLDVLTNWGGFGADDDQFNSPYDVSVADNGWIYVADSAHHTVKVFENPIFADGFESGDLSTWSTTAP